MSLEIMPQRIVGAVWRGVSRYWPLIILVTVLAAAGFRLKPAEYVASVDVLLFSASSQLLQPSDLAQSQALARNYAALVRSDGTLRDAAMRLGSGWDVEQLRHSLAVTPNKESFYLSIAVSHADRVEAARATNAVAQAFIERTQDVQRRVQEPVLANAREQIASLTEQLKLVDERIALAVSSPAAAPADQAAALIEGTMRGQTVASLITIRQQLLGRIQDRNAEIRLALSKQQEAAILWQPAFAPDRPTTSLVLDLTGTSVVFIIAVVVATAVAARNPRPTKHEERRPVAKEQGRSV